ncbi:hypothetical protein CWO84_02855 [Methylomonas sp. Kb3]|uniref:hypothetical protein n=1 Tax=Methylomonas sp. Kb3 TaxID=1611544 RepID=UPI000C32318F|nr:hypothetical protein [Methylomonas sp. Kb3]PKD41981.1 hypothetical protein CWO84_02855 [Methylomonas sp. Kb3]
MNMQEIDGDVLIAAQNRIAELQETVRVTQFDIQNKRDVHDRQRQAARESFKTNEDEFLSANPVLIDDDFSTENSVIAAAQAEANALDSFLKSGPYPLYPAEYNI